MYRLLIFIIALAFLASCKNDHNNSSEKEEFDNLFAEVMKIHDDVMPETNNLYKLKKFAQSNIKVLPDTSSYIEKLLNVQLTSDKADDAMMDWMANFKIPDTDHKGKMEYLEKEKKAITQVREIMLSTLYDGKMVIRNSDNFIKENKLRDDAKTTLVPSR